MVSWVFSLQNAGHPPLHPLQALADRFGQFHATQVNVEHGRLERAMTSIRRNLMQVSRENARWFVYSGVFVAAAQGFLYSALALAPIMLVIPLLQLSLVFRFLFAYLLNPHHEVFGFLVVFGSVVSIIGACAVSIDTDPILHFLSIPDPLRSYLRSQL